MWSGAVKLRGYEREEKENKTNERRVCWCAFGQVTLLACLWPVRSLFFASRCVPGFFVVFALGNDERLACSEVGLYMFSDTRTLPVESGLGFCALWSRSFSSQKLF
jgi:hypothetical protein